MRSCSLPVISIIFFTLTFLSSKHRPDARIGTRLEPIQNSKHFPQLRGTPSQSLHHTALSFASNIGSLSLPTGPSLMTCTCARSEIAGQMSVSPLTDKSSIRSTKESENMPLELLNKTSAQINV